MRAARAKEDWTACASLAGAVFDPVRPVARLVARLERFPTVAELDALLRDRLGLYRGVALEPQAAKRRRGPVARDALYAARVHLHARVPTRERSLHDLANALVWAVFPRAKRALAARQYAILEARLPAVVERLPGARTREEDALAMVDEGGLVLLVEPGAEATARAHLEANDADRLAALADRGLLAPLGFGHALLEHAAADETSVRAFGIVLGAEGSLPSDPEARTAEADAALAGWIESGREREGRSIALVPLLGLG